MTYHQVPATECILHADLQSYPWPGQYFKPIFSMCQRTWQEIDPPAVFGWAWRLLPFHSEISPATWGRMNC